MFWKPFFQKKPFVFWLNCTCKLAIIAQWSSPWLHGRCCRIHFGAAVKVFFCDYGQFLYHSRGIPFYDEVVPVNTTKHPLGWHHMGIMASQITSKINCLIIFLLTTKKPSQLCTTNPLCCWESTGDLWSCHHIKLDIFLISFQNDASSN